MGRKWNPEGIPDDNLIPDGNFLFEIADIEEDTIKGKCVFKPDLTITEPKAYKGRKLFLTYWCGSDEDPDWRDPQSKSTQGQIDLKKLMRLSGVKLDDDLPKCIEAARGRVVGITVGKKERKDGSREDNVARAYWKVGERAVEVFDAKGGSVKPSAPKPAVAPKPAPVPVVVDEDDDEDETPPAPVRSTEALPKPGKPKKADMKNCPKCEQPFMRNELMSHMADCTVGDEDEEDDD